jgi:cell division protein FtsA
MAPKSKIFCGIDIGSSKVVVLIVSVIESGKISVLGVATMPSKGIKKGQMVDIEGAADVIKECLKAAERMAGHTITSALVSIGGAHIESTNTHAVVAISPDRDINGHDLERLNEIAKAVALPSSREILHTLPISYIIDGQAGISSPLEMNGSRLEADTHIISGSSVAISNLAKCMEKVGIGIEKIIFSGIASAESMLTETEKELGVIVIDLGAETVDIVIIYEDAVVYSVVIPIGTKYITNDIAIGLKVTMESAESIKRGVADLALKDDENMIIKARVKEILELVKIEIKKSKYGLQVPLGVVVCGGGALTVGLIDQIRRTLTFPARIGKIESLGGLVDEISSPAFATAAGLILYGSKTQTKNGKSFPIRTLFNKVTNLIKSLLPLP